MKNFKKVIRCFAAVALMSCGGLSESDVESALKNNQLAERKSNLNFVVGEKWTSHTTVREVTNLPFKLENGNLDLCNFNSAQNTAGCAGIPSGVIALTETETLARVVSKSLLASSPFLGFAVEETRTITTQNQLYFPNPDTFSNGNTPFESKVASVYTLAEFHHFVTKIEPGNGAVDSDAGQGRALYPSRPEKGRNYTDDQGYSWTISTATKNVVAGKSYGTLLARRSSNQVHGDVEIKSLRDQCFEKSANGPAITLNFRSDQSGNQICDTNREFLVAEDISYEINYDLIFKAHRHEESISLSAYGARLTDGTLANPYPNTLPDTKIVILFIKRIYDETTTLDALTFK